jgi:hypothetical protein
MANKTNGDVTVSKDVAAPPEVVWEMVTDLPRMGEWSPESQGGHWRDGVEKPAVGARFTGSNRNGLFRWKTNATVVEMMPRTVFSFDVSVLGIAVSNWRYEIEPTDSGCTVTETWTDHRARWFAAFALLATGVGDRESHNRETMETTLDALAAAAEKAATPG